MNKTKVNELREFINLFLSGVDQSLRLTKQVEDLLLEEFSEATFYDDLILSLSLYRPGGGEYLDDENLLSQEMRRALEYLDQLY